MVAGGGRVRGPVGFRLVLADDDGAGLEVELGPELVTAGRTDTGEAHRANPAAAEAGQVHGGQVERVVGHAGTTSTGMPFTTALPEISSTRWPGASRLLLTPGCSRATDSRTPSTVWPHPWGRETTPGIISSETSMGTSSAPASERTRATRPSSTPTRRAASGAMASVRRSLPFMSTLTLCIHELLERR